MESVLSDRSIFGLVRNPTALDMNTFRSVIHFYMRDYYWSVLTLLCSVYVILQAFAIPGPAIIAVLMSALFGGIAGGVMSMACALAGSSICYYIFRLVGRPFLRRFFSEGLISLKSKLDENRDNMFFYFLFLRVTPILPNWFINISSGNLGVSYPVFFFGSLFGLIPNAIILARAGVELASLGGKDGVGAFDAQRVISLLAIGLLALLPVVIKKTYFK
jgi:uncharacterized membrane protein YdjX (TVP38/TMEM64 family)